MPNYKPYLTDDGSIGLYSEDFSDVFHSRTGALSEAYEKFVLPADIDSVIKKYDEINLLDICYGIGYNSKAFLNYIIKNNFYYKNFKEDKFDNKYNASIGSDNNIMEEKGNNIEAICVDNITANISASDNVKINSQNKKCNLREKHNNFNIELECPTSELMINKKISIDALELEKDFVYLSPFIKENCYNSDYKILPEINLYLVQSLLNQCGIEFINYLQNEPTLKKYSKFFDLNESLNINLYYNSGYKTNQRYNLVTLLHNIYYHYISKQPCTKSTDFTVGDYQNVSKRYRVDLFTLLKKIISINFHFGDARTTLTKLNKKYNFIFLDAFTPAKAPCLWSVEFFTNLLSILYDDGVILTYSNSARIRSAMKEAGFFIGCIKDKNNLPIGTIASKSKFKIQVQLSRTEELRLDSKSGIPYRDTNFNSTNDEIIKRLNGEINASLRPTISQIMKGEMSEL